MDAAVRSTRSRRTLPAAALLVSAVAGASVLMTSGADAAPTPTADVSMLVRTSTGALSGDTGSLFEVSSFDWGVPVTNNNLVATPSKIGAQSLQIARPLGQGSPVLVATAAKGLRLTSVEIVVNTRSGDRAPVKIAQYKLENCLITDIHHGANANGNANESLELTCNTSTVTTTVPAANGSVPAERIGKITKS